MLKYERLILGELATNCYLLWEEKSHEGVIIDPADEGVFISETIEKLGIKVKYILATHGHFDHNLGALDLKLIYNIPYCASQRDWFLLERQEETAKHFLGTKTKRPNLKGIDIDLDQIDELEIGKEKIKIIKTPGHTPGGLSFWCKDWLFDGDLIFAEGLRGDSRHSYSSNREMFRSICHILKLPGGVEILPGHGEATTIARAKDYFNCDYCELN